jgi:aminopeptidase N
MKRNIRRMGCAVAILVHATAAFAQRLPTNVSPTHYDLSVTTDLQKATFGGRERIEVTLTAPSRTVTLNAAEIEFDSVTISAGGQTQRAGVTLAPSHGRFPRAPPKSGSITAAS